MCNIELNCDLSDLEWRLDELESNLSTKMDHLESTVMIWSN